MKKYILGLFMLTAFNLFSQEKSYVDYYHMVNKAEEEFVQKMDSSCFKYYDKAFAGNKPFLKDPYIAAQIALYLNDTARFDHYLKIAFQNGMPLKSVVASKFIKDRYQPNLYKRINQNFKRNYVEPHIDKELQQTICQLCYESDSLKLKAGADSPQFHASENKARIYIRDYLVKKGIFPNEHLLGITTSDMLKDFYKKNNKKDLYAGTTSADYAEESELRLKCPMNIILHSQCFFQENKELLFQAVEAGYLHPKDYGIMEEAAYLWFKKTSTNKQENCKIPAEIVSYNILGVDPARTDQVYDVTEQGIRKAEANRAKIYMQKFSVDRRKHELQEKYGFAFFFDFVDRP
ncbi:hypothetical protein [Fluviicola sp.]|uniref:hypothetical protein n=1 Tax=Fluviicola sp. TaxID=1917219 RepID=UPI0031D1D5E6